MVKRFNRTVRYPGTLKHFKAFMYHLAVPYLETGWWPPVEGLHRLAWMPFSESDIEASYYIAEGFRESEFHGTVPVNEHLCGTIRAYETPDRYTVVAFRGPPENDAWGMAQGVGRAIEEFAEFVVSRFPEQPIPSTAANGEEGRRQVGRPGLDRGELVYRLAKAQEGEELKRSNPRMTWKEIARHIEWRQGYNKAAIKLLEDARNRLHRLEESDPEGLLDEVSNFRKERIERKET